MREKQKFDSLQEEDIEELSFETITIGEWTFKVKSVTAYKTKVYGEPYEGIFNIDIVDGKAHINGLHCDNFTKRCFMTAVSFVRKRLGIKDILYKRIKNLKDKFKKVKTD